MVMPGGGVLMFLPGGGGVVTVSTRWSRDGEFALSTGWSRIFNTFSAKSNYDVILFEYVYCTVCWFNCRGDVSIVAATGIQLPLKSDSKRFLASLVDNYISRSTLIFHSIETT